LVGGNELVEEEITDDSARDVAATDIGTDIGMPARDSEDMGGCGGTKLCFLRIHYVMLRAVRMMVCFQRAQVVHLLWHLLWPIPWFYLPS